MRALVLSDIHANLEALVAVLDAAATLGYDALWNLGDSVGYGGSPNEVIERIRPLASVTVRGNHDRVCCGMSSAANFNPVARAAVEWTRNELTDENRAWLRDLPQGPLHPLLSPAAPAPILVAAGSGSETAAPLASEAELDPTSLITAIACAHGSPLHEDHYILSVRDAWAPLQQSPAAVTFIGHTHLQGGFTEGGTPASPGLGPWQELRPRYHGRAHAETFSVRLDPASRYLINPGSVGQPRDGDWRAAFALFNTDSHQLTFHRVPYDVTAAAGQILMAGLPERLALRLREGR